jgi:thiol-disulfide isomerase/thioredoxin
MRTAPFVLLLLACTPAEDDAETPTQETTPIDDAAASYGPENQWSHVGTDVLPSDLEGTGYEVGDIAPNWTGIDQFGDEVELYQFYGKVIVLDVFAEWCPPCNDLAPEGEDFYKALADQDVILIGAMQQDGDGEIPGHDAVLRWSETHGLSHPVLADTTNTSDPFATIGGGYPTFPVIGPDMRVILSDLYPPTVDGLTALLEEEGVW